MASIHKNVQQIKLCFHVDKSFHGMVTNRSRNLWTVGPPEEGALLISTFHL